MKNPTGLLIVAIVLAAIAIALEMLRHVVAPRSPDGGEFLFGVEIFVWIFVGVALLRRHNVLRGS